MKTFRVQLLALMFITEWLPSSMVAQTPSTGLTRLGTFEGSPDTVNLGNLNVHLDVPIRHKAGRGLDFAYDLMFDSYVWGVSNGAWTLNTSMGWTASKNTFDLNGNYYTYTTSNQATYACLTTSGQTVVTYPPSSPAGYLILYYNYAYVDLDGVSHNVPGVVSDYYCNGDQGPRESLRRRLIELAGYELSDGSAGVAGVGIDLHVAGVCFLASGRTTRRVLSGVCGEGRGG